MDWFSGYFEEMVCRYTLKGNAENLVFSADHTKLIGWTNEYGNVNVWDLRSGKAIQELSTCGAEDGGKTAVTPNGELIVYNFQQFLSVRHLLSGETLFTIDLDYTPDALATFSNAVGGVTEVNLIVAFAGGAFGLPPASSALLNLGLDLRKPQDNHPVTARMHFTIIPSEHHPHPLMLRIGDRILVSPDGDAFLCQASDQPVKPEFQTYYQQRSHQLWDYERMEPIRIFETPQDWRADALAKDPKAETLPQPLRKGRLLASGTRQGSLKVWDLSTDTELCSIPGESPSTMTLDGRLLVCSTENNEILIWDVVNQQPIRTLKGHPPRLQPQEHRQSDRQRDAKREHIVKIQQVAISPNHDIVSLDTQGNMKIWSWAEDCAVAAFKD